MSWQAWRFKQRPETEEVVGMAFDFLEAEADEWAEAIDLPSIARNLASAAEAKRAEAIDAMLRLAFVEGAYRGAIETIKSGPIVGKDGMDD